MTDQEELCRTYSIRFQGLEEYRNKVWKILVENFFGRWIPPDSRVLDLGCGYGEFINNVSANDRHAMDLNPEASDRLDPNIQFHQQDCSKPWSIEENSLDLVFTSNFFEHLPNKQILSQTIRHIYRHLKPNGRLIMLGPNIAALKGNYWDFWDHHVPLSDQSACELLELHGFAIEKSIGRFLPYNMVRIRRRPLALVKLYIRLPFIWRFFGAQFLIISQKS
jgi:SAM-dependent methyltransferase